MELVAIANDFMPGTGLDQKGRINYIKLIIAVCTQTVKNEFHQNSMFYLILFVKIRKKTLFFY